MADESTVDTQNTEASAPAKKATAARKTAAKKTTTAKKTASTAKKATAPAAEATEAPAKKAAAKKATTRKASAAKKAAAAPAAESAETTAVVEAPAEAAPAKKAAARKTTTRKTAAKKAVVAEAPEQAPADVPAEVAEAAAPAKKAAARKTAAKKAPAKKAAAPAAESAETTENADAAAPAKKAAARKTAAKKAPAKKAAAPVVEATETPSEATDAAAAPGVLFQAPAKTTRKTSAARSAADGGTESSSGDEQAAPRAKRGSRTPRKATEAKNGADGTEPAAGDERRATRAKRAPKAEPVIEEPTDETEDEATEADQVAETAVEADAVGDEAAADSDEQGEESEDDESGTPARRRRRRGGRRRRKPAGEGNGEGAEGESDAEGDTAESADEQGEDGEEQAEGGTSRRRRRRRRAGEAGSEGDDDPNTVVKVRESRPLEQQITAVSGSTRLEAKKQRRREGREAGRRRAPIVSEAEFLARRESVERVMVIRQREDLTQIGVLEDKVLVEHYVARESQTSLIGNIYLGRVQNVLPSMEAAFVDIGKGRNAVLYAGEVNWAALGWKEGQPRKIESVLSSGQTVLVQVTKDPIGHKGARLTSQISLAGRFLVYVPDGTTSGISRKLPDTERNRLKTLLKEIVPDTAGVIVRTAAEGASEEELTRDVERLKARWEDIEAKTSGKSSNPQLLYGEPDLTLKVVRDLFTEDFAKLVIQGDDAWETVKGYVDHVAPDLAERLERFVPGEDGKDAFLTYRIDEQISKGLDRKVWLPSGGSLIIDRTEAMTVVDVNTGKFTGSGGNLEETVTKNNLEAAEEIVRQLRLRDIGGIIVVDFIDMVLESNRDLVLRRLVECLGRDRTRHQVAEVTSLGLVQMTRKRIGTGLLEAFSETCTHCHGRGVITHDHPVEEGKSSGVAPDEPRRSRRRGGKGKGAGNGEPAASEAPAVEPALPDDHKHPSPAEFAAMARHEDEDAEAPEVEASDVIEPVEPAETVEPVIEQAADETPTETPAATPAEAPTVTVVTRSRGRRGASRPTGVTTEASTAPLVIAEPAAVPVSEVATPEPPKVITRTRGGASRAVTTAEPAEAAPSPSEEHPMEHVPVKKRGARKR